MLMSFHRSQTSIILRCKILDSSVATGAGKAGLSSSTSGLIISTITDNEAAPTVYTQAAAHIESISTLGTFATPTSSKCRFKEVDATNHPGIYELQIDDARFAVSSAKSLLVSISGGTNVCETDFLVPLTDLDPYSDTVKANLVQILGTALTETAGYLAAAFKQFFNIATPAGTVNLIAANVTEIAGSTQAATNEKNVMASLGHGSVDTGTFSPTTTDFETSFVVDNDLFTKENLLWTSGANAGFTSNIITYTWVSAHTKVQLTLKDALPVAPSNGDAFIIIGRTN